MTVDEVRSFAMALPGTVEQPHHEMSSFRVRGRIFATVPPDDEHLHVMVDEMEARAAAEEHASFCEVLWWGKKIAGVRVTLTTADRDAVRDIIETAYRRRM